jgi:hypothetical protein
MTQHQDDPPTAEGPAAARISPPVDENTGSSADDSSGSPADDGTRSPAGDSFTLAGTGSDPAAPAVRPVTASVTAPVTPPVTAPSGDYDKYGVPTMDFVRNKIEARYAASLGAEELARETAEAKSFEQREEERAKAAEAALERIRQSLRDHRKS